MRKIVDNDIWMQMLYDACDKYVKAVNESKEVMTVSERNEIQWLKDDISSVALKIAAYSYNAENNKYEKENA